VVRLTPIDLLSILAPRAASPSRFASRIGLPRLPDFLDSFRISGAEKLR